MSDKVAVLWLCLRECKQILEPLLSWSMCHILSVLILYGTGVAYTLQYYSPPQRLWVEKNWGKSRGKERKKITIREGSLCQMPHLKLALSGGHRSTFSIFNLHAWDHYDQTSLTPCSYHQWSQLGLFG